MTPRPISLREPQLAKLLEGSLTALRRPWGPNIARLSHGGRLWVREPFSLPARWNKFSPTSAERAGAIPVFTDFNSFGSRATLAQLGRRRFARELLRVWHRQHLLIARVERQRLSEITQSEIAAEGFVSREDYAKAWDANLAVSNATGNSWAEDPLVAVLHFIRIAAPLPVELAQ